MMQALLRELGSAVGSFATAFVFLAVRAGCALSCASGAVVNVRLGAVVVLVVVVRHGVRLLGAAVERGLTGARSATCDSKMPARKLIIMPQFEVLRQMQKETAGVETKPATAESAAAGFILPPAATLRALRLLF